MLRIGCLVLSAWCGLNLLASGYILVDTLLLGGHTPALYLLLSAEEARALGPDALATVDSIAVFANGLNVGLCLIALGVIWFGVYRRVVWCFWTLLAGLAAALGAGIAADAAVGTIRPDVNVISGLILAVGFGFAGAGLRRSG